MTILEKKRELLLSSIQDIDKILIEKLDKIVDVELLKLENIQNLEIDEVKLRYKSIVEILKAYNTKGTKVYASENIYTLILDKLEYLKNTYYNLDTVEKKNWWHFEIGIPILLNEIFILLPKNTQTYKMRKEHLEVSKYFQPDPRYSGNNKVALHPSGKPFRKSLGGNRVDTVKISLYRACLLDNESEIELALDSIKEVVDLKDDISQFEKGEDRVGFYLDGSFVQHEMVAYNGTYGYVLLSGFVEILYVIKGTKYEEKLKSYDKKILDLIFNSFEPFFYDGAFTDALSGRAITRENSSDMKIGHLILTSFLLFSKTVNNKELDYVIEREISRARYKYDYLKEENQIFYYYLIKEVLNRVKNKKYVYKRNVKICKNMARVFVREDSYAFCISTYSKYICNYESMNGENKKGYFTGDAMYYLYTKDNSYTNYWNNADMDYMSGTIELRKDITENISMMTKENFLKIDRKDDGFILSCKFSNWDNRLKTDKKIVCINSSIYFEEDNIQSDNRDSIYLTLANLLYYKKPKVKKISDTKYVVNGVCYTLDKDYGKVFMQLKKFENRYFFKLYVELNKDVKNIKWKMDIGSDVDE